MKIRTKNGQILHVEKNATTQILLDAGLAEIVLDTPKPPANPITWQAAVDIHSSEPYIEARRGNEKMRFTGPGAELQSFGGQQPPANVIARFKALRKMNPKQRAINAY